MLVESAITSTTSIRKYTWPLWPGPKGTLIGTPCRRSRSQHCGSLEAHAVPAGTLACLRICQTISSDGLCSEETRVLRGVILHEYLQCSKHAEDSSQAPWLTVRTHLTKIAACHHRDSECGCLRMIITLPASTQESDVLFFVMDAHLHRLPCLFTSLPSKYSSYVVISALWIPLFASRAATSYFGLIQVFKASFSFMLKCYLSIQRFSTLYSPEIGRAADL